MMDDLLKQITAGKSNLAKAIMSGNKELIEKRRRELENVWNAYVSACPDNDHVVEVDDQSYSSESVSEDGESYIPCTGWTPEDTEDEEDEPGQEVDEVNIASDSKQKSNEQGKEHDEVMIISDSKKKTNEQDNEPDDVIRASVGSKRKRSKRDDNEKCKRVKAKTVQRKRPRHMCPVEGCEAEVIDIPRHLREVHDWRKEKARKATSRYGMRKSFGPKPVKEESESSAGKRVYKDYHRHRACPVQGCKSVVKRLSGHLRQVHPDIAVGSPMYRKILREARKSKTWKPSDQNKHLTKVETVQERSSMGDSEDEVEITNDTDPSELPSAEEEQAIMELAEDADCSNEETEMTVTSSLEDAGCLNEKTEMTVMSSFCNWLQSADGGRKPEKLSKQHASQLLRILEIIDPQKQLTSLFNKTLLRDTFLKYAEKRYTADTVKAYLLSLRHFCSYVIAEEPRGVDVDPALVCKTGEKARLWSMSYKKDSKRRHLEKMSRDLNDLVTPEMVNEFERSESARSAIAYLDQLSGAHSLKVNQSMYTLVRDYILLEITIANAHRSGVLANMTMGEYHNSKQKQDSIIISVNKHKTADTHGPARVVISPSLFSYLRIYITELRSQVADSTSDDNLSNTANVFLSWNGAKLESGQISTAINAVWRKAGMQGHITSTLFRKSAVTNVHKQHTEMKSDLADLMAHKETTAQRFYRLKEKEEACLQAASNLPNIMRLSEPNKVVKETPATSKPSDGDTLAIADKNTAVDASNKRMQWKEEDVIALKDIFAKEIEAKSVTMDVVKSKIKGHPRLLCLDARKVYDKIRSEWRFSDNTSCSTTEVTDNQSSAELPKESLTLAEKMSRFFSDEDSSVSMVPPSNSSYASRNIFTDEHRKYLLQKCGGIIKSGVISQPAVKELLCKEEEGREMLREFTLKQIINRLKYERRLNRKSSST